MTGAGKAVPVRRALVTGGSAGLGAAFVDSLQRRGYEVISIDRDPPASHSVGGSAGSSAGFRHISCDLADREALDSVLDGLAASPALDLVVLNAGVSATGRFETIDPSTHLDVLRINAEAPMVISTRLLAQGAFNPGAVLLFVASLSHFTGYPGAAGYAASKDALTVFARSMRKAAKARDVSITVAFPGPLRTAHAERHAPKGADASKRMQPDRAAELILHQALTGRATAIPGAPNRVFALLGRLAPKPVTGLMRRLIYTRLDQ